MGNLDGQGGSADTRGTASCEGLTEPHLASVLTGPSQDMLEVAMATEPGAGVAVMVGGLCLFGIECLCFALGDLFSLRAVMGETVATCRRLPGLKGVGACLNEGRSPFTKRPLLDAWLTGLDFGPAIFLS